MTAPAAAPAARGRGRAVLGALLLLLLLTAVFLLRHLLAPFVMAFVVAYVLAPVVNRVESYGVPRTLAILGLFAGFFAGVGGLVFAAGGQVSHEVAELSQRFLREEWVERELTLTNTSTETARVRLQLVETPPGGRFTLVSPPGWVLQVLPGGTATVRLRFAPPDTGLAEAALVLDLLRTDTRARVELRGNAQTADSGPPPVTDQVRVRDLLVSDRQVDFGLAGPNLITSLSQSAASVQPLVRRYLGTGFDVQTVVAAWGRSLLNEHLLGHAAELLDGFVSGITIAVLVPFIAFFFLKEGSAMLRGVIELVPNAHFELCLNLLHQISGQIGGYLRGQLVATAVVAALAVVGLHVVGVDYALPLGLLAGFANIIPFLGPAIGLVAAVLVVVATGGGAAMLGWVVVLYALIQLVDNLLVQPTVVARSVEMHPLVVLFAVMVGSQVMGIVGMLVAVPLFGIAKVTAQTVAQGLRGYRTQ